MSKADQKSMINRGLKSLLSNIDADLKTKDGHLRQDVVTRSTGIMRIPISLITANPRQPRKDFDEKALEELAASIRIHNIIQPLTVTRIGDDKYRIIAGERRFRASKMAGLQDIPVYIREANDNQILELSLLENLQREDLNAIEISLSYKRLMDELHYTQEEVAERMGKERSTVANYIRLLKLPPDLQIAVRSGLLSMGHARALVNVDEIDKQLYLFKEITSKGLSVRQTEQLVRNLYKKSQGSAKKPSKAELDHTYKRIEDKLASHFGTRVTLKKNSEKSGSITLDYYSVDELNKILQLVGVSI